MTSRPSRPKAARGMTLIEVMIAGTILIIGVTGIFAGWSSVMATLEHERRFAAASNLVRTRMEQLMLLKPGATALSAGAHELGRFDAFGSATDDVNASYQLTYTAASNQPSTGFVALTLTATWTERSRTRTTQLTAFRER